MKAVVAIGAVLSLLLSAKAHSQGMSAYNPRDDRYKSLGLTRARAEYDRASGDLARANALSARGFLSQSELAAVRATFERSRVDYMQQALAIMASVPHIVISAAVKSRSADGKPRVVITVQNVGQNEPSDSVVGFPPELLRELRSGAVRDVFISLKTEPGVSGTTISRPYERRIARLVGSQPARLEFTMLRDVSDVVVSITTGEHTEERRVMLETDLSGSAFAVHPAQSSLEGTLGSQLTYDIVVERASGGANTAQLAVRALSPEVQHEFRDAESKARLNRVHFADGQTQKRVQLILTLPALPGANWHVGQPTIFWVIAADSASDASRNVRASERDESETVHGGQARLEMLIKGMARAEVGIINLFQEVRLRDSISTQVSVRNVGSAPLLDARLEAEAAPGWQVRFHPAKLNEILPGASAEVRVTVVPERSATVGDYEVRMHVESGSQDQHNSSDEKVIRIRVMDSVAWASVAGLVTGVLLLIGGVGTAGWRILRR